MKVFLKNYNSRKASPASRREKCQEGGWGGESPPAGGKNAGENAGEDRAETQEIGRSAQKGPPGAARRPHQSSPIFTFSRFFQNPVFRNSYRIS